MRATSLRLILPTLALGLLASAAVLPARAQTATEAPAAEAPAAEAPAAAPAPETVVATVNGRDVTEGDLAIAESDLDQQFSQLPAEQRRAAALSAVIEIRLISAKAEAEGLADGIGFEQRMAFLRDRALHSAYVEDQVAAKVTDEAVRARYDKEIADTPPSNEIRARHILVKTKEEAEAIIKQLDEGGDFEAIAKEKSSDPGSGAAGGDLGYFGQGQMVPEFETAAFALDVGAHSKEPVESQFGFHVIKVEDKRTKQPPAYETVRDQLRSLMLREGYFEAVKTLRDGATVDIADPALKAALQGVEGEAEAEKPAQ